MYKYLKLLWCHCHISIEPSNTNCNGHGNKGAYSCFKVHLCLPCGHIKHGYRWSFACVQLLTFLHHPSLDGKFTEARNCVFFRIINVWHSKVSWDLLRKWLKPLTQSSSWHPWLFYTEFEEYPLAQCLCLCTLYPICLLH